MKATNFVCVHMYANTMILATAIQTSGLEDEI